MNPLAVEAIGAVLRALLNIGAGYLVSRGIWTSERAEVYVGAAAMALLSLGWTVWRQGHMRVKLLTALGLAGVSEHEVEAMVKDPTTPNPPVAHPKSEVPALPSGHAEVS